MNHYDDRYMNCNTVKSAGCARPSALKILFHANVGRCPTLVCTRLSAFAAREDARPPAPNFDGRKGYPYASALLRLCERKSHKEKIVR